MEIRIWSGVLHLALVVLFFSPAAAISAVAFVVYLIIFGRRLRGTVGITGWEGLKKLTFCSAWLTSGVFPSGVVTLKSIQIFNTHEWFNAQPTVYFHCKGGNKTILPDVKKADVLYTFKGEESWQPLTELPDGKCKRCGLYEEDILKDDTFDEWEFCSDDFIDPNGNYVRMKNKEFNATFVCLQCVHQKSSDNASGSSNGENTGKKTNVILVILIIAIVSTVSVLGMVAAYRYWKQRKREQDQARFLKLFEEGDDIFFDEKDIDDAEAGFALRQEL